MAVAATGELRVVNPATLELVGTVTTTDPSAVQEIVSEARLAQDAWGETPLADRRALLVRVAETVLERADEIADTVVAETGKATGRGVHDRALSRARRACLAGEAGAEAAGAGACRLSATPAEAQASVAALRA